MALPWLFDAFFSDAADRDDPLAQRLRTGDPTAFRTTFDRYYAELVVHAERYVGRRAVAEELVQDTFGTLWERRSTLPRPLNIRAYCYAMVRHAALKVVRREWLEARTTEASVDTSQTRADVLDALSQADTAAALYRAIAALPERLRAVVRLRWGQQLPIAEVADILGVTPKAIETYITRAVKALRTALADQDRRAH